MTISISRGDDSTPAPLTAEHRQDFCVSAAPAEMSVCMSHRSRRPDGERLKVSNTGSMLEYYAIGTEVLGQGGFGLVRVATHIATGNQLAAKMIRQGVILCTQHFQKEIDITMFLEHPNIVKTFESFEDNNYVYFVMEWCRGGELFHRVLASTDGKFTESDAASILQQSCLAISYMHDNYIVHRDLKPENFLFESGGPVDCTPLKLIDFGLARRFEPGEVMTSAVGTPSYVAPEVLRGAHRASCDLWSIGVLLYICLCGCVPFDADNPKDILRRVKKGAYSLDHVRWSGVSEEAKLVVRALLDKNPGTRITAPQVLDHDWLKRQLLRELPAQQQLSEPRGISPEVPSVRPDRPASSQPRHLVAVQG